MPDSSSGPLATEVMQQASEWFVRLRADDMSEPELYAFADWLAQDHKHSEAFAATEQLFADMVVAAQLLGVTAENNSQQGKPAVSSLGKASLFFSKPKPKSSWGWWWPSAAICVLAFLFVLPLQPSLFDGLLSDYYTHTGEVRELELADGSHLLLDTNTAISTKLGPSIRQIVLHHGQVRFSVASDKHRPFEVVVDGLTVRALGTVFDIYKHGSDDVTVTVQEHAVSARIQAAGLTGQLTLVQAGQQLRYHPGGILSKPEAIDVTQALAWQQQQLFVNDRPLAELLDELSRYRLGRVFVSDEKLKNLRVTGVFSLAKPDEVLSHLCEALNLKQTRFSPWWVLLHR